MATLSPGIGVVRSAEMRVVSFVPNPTSVSWGSISVPMPIDGFLYEPPTEGQLWPRGDYAPRG